MPFAHAILNLSGGFVAVGSFAPWSYYPLICVSLIAALFSWSQLTPRLALRYGYVFGFAYALGSVYWVYYSLHDYGGAHPAFAGFMVLLCAMILAFYYALLAWVFASLKRYCGAWQSHLLLFPSLWTLAEWLRSFSTVGFPWNLAGQALIDSPLAGIFPLFGVYGASFIVAFVAAAIVWLYRCDHLQARIATALVAITMITASLATSYMQWTSSWSQPVSFALIQANVQQNIKFDRASFKSIVRDYTRLTRQHLGSELIVWPETAIPLYADQLQRRVLPLIEEDLKQSNSHLLAGVFHRDDSGSHNSMINVSDGSFYHKKRLVPFGETIPLRGVLDFFSDWIYIPMSDLSVAPSSALTTVGDHQVGLSICYESAFPSDIAAALPNASYLVNVSNDSWFGDSIAPFQFLQITRLRAAETGRNLLRATSTGISALVDFRGKIVSQTELFEQQVLTGQVQPRRGMTPYTQAGNIPVLGAATVLIIWSLWGPRLTRRKQDV